MMKDCSKRKLFGLGIFSCFVVFLVVCTCCLTITIFNRRYSNDNIKVNDETVKYISFLFEHNENHVLEIKNPKVVSDDVGKFLFGEDYFTFDINVDKDELNEDLEYMVVAEAIGKTIDENYIKFYLTDDQGNILYDGNHVPVFGEFEVSDDTSGKIIYSGKFDDKVTSKSLKLRVWVSDEYDLDDVAGFSYHLNVIAK